MDGALAGIQVLELSRHLAGPFAAMTLGDLGADVIKVEPPERGDDTRWFPPYWNGESTYYLSTNRNKRSMTLNLKSAAGQDILRSLVKQSDILIENFRPGTMERWGLSYEELAEINPRLIYCAVTAFGSDGPDRDRAGVDLLMQGETGLMSITGESGRPPVRAGTSLIDLTTGANAVQGILAALYVRERTGKGQRIDVSLLGGGVSWLTYHATAYFATGEVPTALGSRHAAVVPYGVYPTKNGYIVLATATNATFARLCKVIDREDLLTDARFMSNPDRVEHPDDLDQILMEVFATQTADEWAEIMVAAGIPAGPVNNLAQVFDMEQVKHQKLVVDIPHEKIPEFRMSGIAINMSGTPATVRLPPPQLGEHTAEILGSIGFTEQDIERLDSDEVL